MPFAFFGRKKETEKKPEESAVPRTETVEIVKAPEQSASRIGGTEKKDGRLSADNSHEDNGNAQSKKTNAVQQEQVTVHLEALIRRNGKVLLDSTALSRSSFDLFIKNNQAVIQQNKHSLFVPDFEYESLQSQRKDSLKQFFDSGILRELHYESVHDYPALLSALSSGNNEKRQLCVVVNDTKKKYTIINAAKGCGVFVRILAVNSDGELAQNTPKKDGLSNQKKEKSSDSPKVKADKTVDTFVIASKPERMTIAPIRLNKPIGMGSTVFDSKNNSVSLTEQVIVNPNAITYNTNIPGMWAKIYNPGSLTTFLEEKAKRMLSKSVKYKGLCWPVDILRDSSGNFVGILLPPAKGEPLQIAIFKQAKLQTYFPDWNKKDLCDLTLSILRVIKYLHNMNILLGCINPAAIRVVGKDEVYFVDTDNYQIEGFPSLVYNTTFTPPELLGRKIYLCSKENENYAVAMLVFMLMMPGKTPYTISKSQTIMQAVQERNFPFPNGNIHGSHAMPGMWRFMWSHLTPFKDVFFNTFQKGGKFEAPESRKTVGNWIGMVLRFREELENPSDPESLKIYPKTFKRGKNDKFYRCRFCGTEYPEFYFNRTYFADYQICNSCIDKRSDVSFRCHACGKTYYYTNRTALFHAMKKKKDSEWKDQKYCSDCKKKTMRCIDCGEEKPYYLLKDGRCYSCNERYRNSTYRSVVCKDCGRVFNITVGEHEYSVQKGLHDPVRCKNCREKKRRGSY